MQVEKTGSFVEVQISENRWNTGCNALVPLEHHYTYFIQRGPCSRPDGNATARRGLDPAPAAGPADCFSSRTPAADSSGHDGSIPGHAAVPGTDRPVRRVALAGLPVHRWRCVDIVPARRWPMKSGLHQASSSDGRAATPARIHH
ncbi:unnamed protein product [Nezara viridula]|uniref:Uncharacterized protein n=1 Tax=Nezara viridula TaxID=85310 RepID=A0A9P0DYS1_NEZVI|nr:unnamed protein product [Nezara viridula]